MTAIRVFVTKHQAPAYFVLTFAVIRNELADFFAERRDQRAERVAS